MKVLIFVPAYNEEKTIESVVADLREFCPQCDYVVVDDGSKDGTRALCERRGFPCISLPVNLGLDGVFQTGMRYAYQKGYDIAMPFDGDGQHNARYITPMLERMAEGCDIVIGSRFVNKKRGGGLRMLGSRMISACFKATTGVTFHDPTSGMRMVNRRVMAGLCQNLNLGPEPDTWALLVRSGAKLCEVPVEMNERTAGTSYFTLARSAAFMMRMCVSILFIQWFRKKVL